MSPSSHVHYPNCSRHPSHRAFLLHDILVKLYNLTIEIFSRKYIHHDWGPACVTAEAQYFSIRSSHNKAIPQPDRSFLHTTPADAHVHCTIPRYSHMHYNHVSTKYCNIVLESHGTHFLSGEACSLHTQYQCYIWLREAPMPQGTLVARHPCQIQ